MWSERFIGLMEFLNSRVVMWVPGLGIGLSLLNHSWPKRILYPHNGSVNVFRNVHTQKWSRKESVLIA